MKKLYEEVTNTIIDVMERGDFSPMTWVKDGVPFNHVTKRKYSGINILLLWMARQKNPCYSNRWLTYKQAHQLGAHVKRGEHGHKVFFYKPITVLSEDDEGNVKELKKVVLRYFVVFNTAQIEGLLFDEESEDRKVPKANSVREALCVSLAQSLLNQAKVVEGGDRAFYSPIKDEIYMPDKYRFDRLTDWYATALHELTHWTGHETRLGRFSSSFAKALKNDKAALAFEELIAELGSAFLSAKIGFEGLVQYHASYIDSWLALLKRDKKAIFKAAAHAQKACDFILKEEVEAEFEDV